MEKNELGGHGDRAKSRRNFRKTILDSSESRREGGMQLVVKGGTVNAGK